MVAKSVPTSMSAKLIHKMNPYGYKKFCAFLSERDSITLDFYKASKWVNYFALDTSLTFKNSKVNPDHVYELFGSFNGLSAHDVRMSLLEYAGENIDFFECRSTICLAMHGMGLDTWVDTVNDHRMCCDELALLGLSAMYQRHCLVFTKNKFWSTIETSQPLNIIDLMKICTVRLLYLGNLKFGTHRWKPHNLQPVKPKSNLGQFNIIEEYTLDEPTTSGEGSTTENGDSQHVETVTPPVSATSVSNTVADVKEASVSQVETKVTSGSQLSIPKDDVIPTKDLTTHLKTTNNNTSLQVETSSISCPTEMPNRAGILIKKELAICLPKLKDTDIDVWLGTVNAYHSYEPPPVEMELKPVITSVHGYSLHSRHSGSHTHQGEESATDTQQEDIVFTNDGEPEPKKARNQCRSASGPSLERLLAHANTLINKVSSFVTEQVNAKHGKKTTPQRNVETSSVITDLPQPVGTEPTSTHDKPARMIRCKICIDSFGSIKELNNHH